MSGTPVEALELEKKENAQAFSGLSNEVSPLSPPDMASEQQLGLQLGTSPLISNNEKTAPSYKRKADGEEQKPATREERDSYLSKELGPLQPALKKAKSRPPLSPVERLEEEFGSEVFNFSKGQITDGMEGVEPSIRPSSYNTLNVISEGISGASTEPTKQQKTDSNASTPTTLANAPLSLQAPQTVVSIQPAPTVSSFSAKDVEYYSKLFPMSQNGWEVVRQFLNAGQISLDEFAEDEELFQTQIDALRPFLSYMREGTPKACIKTLQKAVAHTRLRMRYEKSGLSPFQPFFFFSGKEEDLCALFADERKDYQLAVAKGDLPAFKNVVKATMKKVSKEPYLGRRPISLSPFSVFAYMEETLDQLISSLWVAESGGMGRHLRVLGGLRAIGKSTVLYLLALATGILSNKLVSVYTKYLDVDGPTPVDLAVAAAEYMGTRYFPSFWPQMAEVVKFLSLAKRGIAMFIDDFEKVYMQGEVESPQVSRGVRIVQDLYQLGGAPISNFNIILAGSAHLLPALTLRAGRLPHGFSQSYVNLNGTKFQQVLLRPPIQKEHVQEVIEFGKIKWLRLDPLDPNAPTSSGARLDLSLDTVYGETSGVTGFVENYMNDGTVIIPRPTLVVDPTLRFKKAVLFHIYSKNEKNKSPWTMEGVTAAELSNNTDELFPMLQPHDIPVDIQGFLAGLCDNSILREINGSYTFMLPKTLFTMQQDMEAQHSNVTLTQMRALFNPAGEAGKTVIEAIFAEALLSDPQKTYCLHAENQLELCYHEEFPKFKAYPNAYIKLTPPFNTIHDVMIKPYPDEGTGKIKKQLPNQFANQCADRIVIRANGVHFYQIKYGVSKISKAEEQEEGKRRKGSKRGKAEEQEEGKRSKRSVDDIIKALKASAKDILNFLVNKKVVSQDCNCFYYLATTRHLSSNAMSELASSSVMLINKTKILELMPQKYLRFATEYSIPPLTK